MLGDNSDILEFVSRFSVFAGTHDYDADVYHFLAHRGWRTVYLLSDSAFVDDVLPNLFSDVIEVVVPLDERDAIRRALLRASARLAEDLEGDRFAKEFEQRLRTSASGQIRQSEAGQPSITAEEAPPVTGNVARDDDAVAGARETIAVAVAVAFGEAESEAALDRGRVDSPTRSPGGNRFEYYAVYRGVLPGVYRGWGVASLHVIGQPGNSYKGFRSLVEAVESMRAAGHRVTDEGELVTEK